MKRLAYFTAALIGLAGVAHAQSQSMEHPMGTSNESGAYNPVQYGSETRGGCGHAVAITDEYGFRYDNMGDRINGRGCVIAPPHTRPGARAIKG